MRLALVVCLALGTSADVAAKPTDPLADAIDMLVTAAKCKAKKPVKPAWCAAAKWSTGTAAPLPKRPLVGVWISLPGGVEAKDAAVDFAYLIVERGGVNISTYTADDDDEKSTARAIAAITAHFEGKTATAKLPKAAAEHVSAVKTYAPKKAGNAWTWKAPMPDPFIEEHLRKVGKFWVSVQTDPRGGEASGAVVSIFTESWESQ